jgi:hypothetical protein
LPKAFPGNNFDFLADIFCLLIMVFFHIFCLVHSTQLIVLFLQFVRQKWRLIISLSAILFIGRSTPLFSPHSPLITNQVWS